MENTQRKVVHLKMSNGRYALSEMPQTAAQTPQPKRHANLLAKLSETLTTGEDNYPENSDSQCIPLRSISNVPKPQSSNLTHINRAPMASKSKPPSATYRTQTEIDSMEKKIDAVMEKVNTIQKQQQNLENLINTKVTSLEKNQSVIKAKLDLILDELSPRPGLVPASTFDWEPISTKEKLEELEKQLTVQEYKQEMKNYLECQLPTDSSEERLHEAMDIIFGRAFTTEMSWTGIGYPDNKIPLCSYVNILSLLKNIGTFHGVTSTTQKIKCFFQNKLKHADQRLH
ncbi:uncharacterized protein LOC125769667 [Anopheles funestus]|uniref:uncharacterized protein LOC125769667 n=1 Tax=Anopheles funestus TaxID=62324 RepID=UPI0020C68787|nr:uncharacterized protein LOC125769667 [Anopheles funestus]